MATHSLNPCHEAPLLSLTRLVSVVIATRNRPESLARCLNSILAQDYSKFEIIVVDNCPSDDRARCLISSRFAGKGNIQYVLEMTPGLAIAHNSGIERAKGDIIAFTDDDVIVDRNWLHAIESSFSTSARVGCVTGLILPAELETRAQVWAENHGGFSKGLLPKSFDLQGNRPSGRLFPYTAGQFGSGANMAFSREALQAIDNFDPALGAGTIARGGDDLAAFHWVVRHGFRLNYEPAAVVWHFHRREEAGMRRQAFNYGVGLGAYLASVIVRRPSSTLHLIRALPQGLLHMFSPGAPRNVRLPADYPRELKWLEFFGILSGIPSFFKSRADVHAKLRQRAC